MTEPRALPKRRIDFEAERQASISPSLEWLVTNGLGGYASGLVSGAIARRYHGILVAALPAPTGRLMCVPALRTTLVYGERRIVIDHEALTVLAEHDAGALRAFILEGGLPMWRYEIDGCVVERRIFMPHGRNATCVSFRLLRSDRPVHLEIQPWLQVRPHESAVSMLDPEDASTTLDNHRAEISVGKDVARIRFHAHSMESAFSSLDTTYSDVHFSEEHARGYEHVGRLWSSCRVALRFDDAGRTALTVGTDGWESGAYRSPDDLLDMERTRRARILMTAGNPQDDFVAELALAADQFLIAPVGHDVDAAIEPTSPPTAAGRTVIAGYHWFTDWGRDTMISLEGLTLDVGRHAEAAQILRLFARNVRDGLVPNLFPEGARSGLYHTADATLWFVHAVGRYADHTGDSSLVADLLPVLLDIVEAHRRGTRFGIGVDPADGLLRQGAEGYQLTWMDAKVDGWVVTPRRGKAVEINALWYNALCILSAWLARHGRPDAAARCAADASRARQSFNRRFWNPSTGWLFDVIDGETGDDDACRPNQIFAVSLPHPVLDREHWAAVVDAVRTRLLTPVGLRSLAPGHPDYQSQYTGDLWKRDASYHQGTVWAWLIGAFVDAELKVSGNVESARAILSAFPAHLSEAGTGSISEIFDADMPHLPRGCIAQAWSVAEVLRAWKRSALSG